MQNAPREHSAIFSTFIKLPFIFKIFVLSIFELPLKTGFTVCVKALSHSSRIVAQLSTGSKDNFFSLHLHPFVECASSKGSGGTAPGTDPGFLERGLCV